MATISFNIPDAMLSRVVDAFCYQYQYGANALEGETANQFARRMMIESIKAVVKSAEQRKAVETIQQDTTLDAIS